MSGGLPKIGIIMITSYCTILILGCVGAVLGNAPPYVQSVEAFVAAKTYVSGNLPNRKMDIHREQDRPHLSFSTLLGIIGGLLLLRGDYYILSNLEVVDNFVPLEWNNYDEVSKATRVLVNDATQKTAVIVNLINSICGSVNVEECNAEVDRRVRDSPFAYEGPADLLLLLGKLSDVIRYNEPVVNSIIQNNNEIPYLLHNVESDQFISLLNLLRVVHSHLSTMSYRRFLSEH